MKKKITIIILSAIIILGGITQLNIQNLNGADIGTEVGQKAPDFSLKNIDGEKVNLRELEGKKVFLNFWASWCKPCQIEMPDIQKLHEEYGEDVEIIAVNLGESKKEVKNFLEMRGYNFTILLDENREIGSKYMVRAIPTTYFLDEKGIITEKHLGVLNYEQMKENLELE